MQRHLVRNRPILALALAGALSACTPAPTVVASGRFEPAASGRPAGSVTIHRHSDGALTLDLRDLPSGSHLDVRLLGPELDGNAPSAFFVVGRHSDAGPHRRFDLPPAIDLGRYEAVAVWDRARDISLATALLTR